ncbi:hypothetical protein L3081_15325 [Colwellia sp. MSW7]|uniref:DUF4397 domain-containing protein n=1 Tax=Colwellia maritima TaxID=2912588 RepID=A0ABS9X2P0_9GAMM|nr:hypothetical protein [Colwellia maritima]MCI2284508.1 hypothetical protein [Colwellia maritima]
MTQKSLLFSHRKSLIPLWLSMIFSLTLYGCGGSDDSNTGYIQLYNLSSNSPGIYLTVDQYDDDDYSEQTYSAISFTKIGSRFAYDPDTYDIELAWQNEYNNQYDLETIYENPLKVNSDTTEFIVIGDIKEPSILIYDIPVRDDDEIDDDNDDEVFNIRVLNMYNDSEAVDIYYSESDETFNEAKLLNQATYSVMSDNQKLTQDEYIFYITLAGSNDILFTSPDITFPYAAEYILVNRANTGVGSSPYMIDIVSTSSVQAFSDTNSEASYRVYNGIVENPLLPEYTNTFDFYINTIDESPEISALNYGEFSSTTLITSGDYGMSLVTPGDQSIIINNHLLALNENTDKTIFFYLLEEAVDEDSDGDIDEDGDGHIDEIEITVNSLIVENSKTESIYSHEMTVVNLIDQDEIIDDFTNVKVYFVRNDEIIETADQYVTAIFATPSTVGLLNNTYSVYVIGKLDSSNIVLASTELTLNEESKNQFVILEKDANTATGYKMTFANQSDD